MYIELSATVCKLKDLHVLVPSSIRCRPGDCDTETSLVDDTVNIHSHVLVLCSAVSEDLGHHNTLKTHTHTHTH